MLPEVSLFLASDASEDDKQQAADELCSRLLDGSVNLLQLVSLVQEPCPGGRWQLRAARTHPTRVHVCTEHNMAQASCMHAILLFPLLQVAGQVAGRWASAT